MKGPGTSYEDGTHFITEFQKMRVTMSRWQSDNDEKNNTETDDDNPSIMPMDNRALRSGRCKLKILV